VSIVHVLRDMDPMTCPTLPLSSLVRHGAYISVTKSQGHGRVDTSEDPPDEVKSKRHSRVGTSEDSLKAESNFILTDPSSWKMTLQV
jgi:hypothetical protein